MALDYFNSLFAVIRVDLHISLCCLCLFLPSTQTKVILPSLEAQASCHCFNGSCKHRASYWMWRVCQPLKACELVFPVPVCQAACFSWEAVYPCERADLLRIRSVTLGQRHPPRPAERRCPACPTQGSLRFLCHSQAPPKSEEVLKGKVSLDFNTDL